MDLLKKMNHSNPLIFIRGVRFEDLIAIVDFLYTGEANVLEEELETFLSLAHDLQLKGLSGSRNASANGAAVPESGSDPTDNGATPMSEWNSNKANNGAMSMSESDSTATLKSERKSKPPTRKKPNSKEVGELGNDKDTAENLSEEPIDENVKVKVENLDEQIRSLMGRSEVNIDSSGRTASICKVCGKEGQWPNIRNHIEANHIDGISHTCNLCGKTSRSRHGLILHNYKYHHK